MKLWWRSVASQFKKFEVWRVESEVVAAKRRFAEGIFKPVWSEEGTLCYVRKFKGHELLVALNRSGKKLTIDLPEEYENAPATLGVSPKGNRLTLKHMDFALIEL